MTTPRIDTPPPEGSFRWLIHQNAPLAWGLVAGLACLVLLFIWDDTRIATARQVQCDALFKVVTRHQFVLDGDTIRGFETRLTADHTQWREVEALVARVCARRP
jgi:hypothetical protein